MPIDYDPKDAVMCWPEGEYKAELQKVEDKTSKVKPGGGGGNPMQVLTWKLYNDEGKTQTISDYIVVPNALFKLKQLAIALGYKDKFEAGEFQADDHIGCVVNAELSIESSPGFEDKNKIGKIKSFALGAATAPKAPNMRERTRQPVTSPDLSEQHFKDDDVPF